MIITTFYYILSHLSDDLKARPTHVSLPPEEAVAVTLRYLATGSTLSDMYYDYRIGVATLSLIIRHVYEKTLTFSQEALQALDDGNLSDLLLSSDDEDNYGDSIRPAPLPTGVSADVIYQNQRELFPPKSDYDEGPSELYNGVPEEEPEDPVNSCEMAENQSEIPSTIEDILQNLTPKQRIAWRHRELVNTIPSDLAVVQAYREYQIDNDLLGTPKKQRLTLLHFRRRLADSLVLQDKFSIAKRGRPSNSSSPMMQIIQRRPGEICPAAEIARDGVGHFPAHDDGTWTRCKMVGWKGKSRVKCIKLQLAESIVVAYNKLESAIV
ncbi:unnamed protein product [Parnassius apollo]|uniref:(apollo) hypothetical protein n=1 Tax=Parnassius apollo TaxID=110799 RepID=A0A8S3WD43_PARAO|nr:unnamed protein product [Parnassius apollo]